MSESDRIRPTRNVLPVARPTPVSGRLSDRERKDREPRQAPDRSPDASDEPAPPHVDEFA
jgi:hypothetical protein